MTCCNFDCASQKRAAEVIMSLEDFIITMYCWIDMIYPEVMGVKRLRSRGFESGLSGVGVVTKEKASAGLLAKKGVFAQQQRVPEPNIAENIENTTQLNGKFKR